VKIFFCIFFSWQKGETTGAGSVEMLNLFSVKAAARVATVASDQAGRAVQEDKGAAGDETIMPAWLLQSHEKDRLKLVGAAQANLEKKAWFPAGKGDPPQEPSLFSGMPPSKTLRFNPGGARCVRIEDQKRPEAGAVFMLKVEHGLNGNCDCCVRPVPCQQTLDELDFERGLWGACSRGDLARVRELLDLRGRDPNERDHSDYTPLHYAARHGHVDMCTLLLNKRAAVDTQSGQAAATALHRACAAAHVQVTPMSPALGRTNSHPDTCMQKRYLQQLIFKTRLSPEAKVLVFCCRGY